MLLECFSYESEQHTKAQSSSQSGIIMSLTESLLRFGAECVTNGQQNTLPQFLQITFWIDFLPSRQPLAADHFLFFNLFFIYLSFLDFLSNKFYCLIVQLHALTLNLIAGELKDVSHSTLER